jgi:hypothetical protein
MKAQTSAISAAILIAIAAGLAAWFTGLARAMWPPHPLPGVLLISVFTGIVVNTLWPAVFRRR